MKRFLSATAMALLLATPAIARETYALLVGAAQYDNLDSKFWLKGPPNDIELVRTFLETNPQVPFAPDHVLVLADHVEGAGRPTLAAIRAAFAELAEKVQPGDFVYLHFSGHGSQAPAADPSTELDGLDELFLPSDIGEWSDTTGEVANALVDDEIGGMIDAIRAKGADVWAVFDSCHSGTVTRGAPVGDDEVATRDVPADALGVPQTRLNEIAEEQSRALPDPAAAPTPPMVVEDEEGKGSLVAFFAAQTNETTPEKNMPRGKVGRKPQGVFTYTIFQALAEHPGITYRQLSQEILRDYSVGNLTRTTPLFEGDLDRVVFGGEETERVSQWTAEARGDTVTIRAGRLHGLSEGMRLAVLASPADATEDALGWVEVTKLDTFSAEVAGADGFDLASLPKGAVLRKVADEVDFTLTVALPAGDSAAAAAMREAAARLQEDGIAGTRLRFVEPGEDADLRLAVLPDSPRPDAIWILTATGLIEENEYANTPSVSTGDKSVDQLATVIGDDFTRMAKAVNLMKIGTASSGSGLGVTPELTKARFDPATDSLDDSNRGPIDTSNVPRLVPNDVLGLKVQNTTEGPLDYNVLYVGSDYSITFMGNGRLQPGDTLDDDFVLIDGKAYGRDRMVVVLSPAGEGTAVEDLSFLEQEAVDMTRGAPGDGDRDLRGIIDGTAQATDLESMLGEAGFGETTRSAVSLRKKAKEKGPGPEILQFEVDAVPGQKG